MNCPTKDTNQSHVPGFNQSPSPLDNDLVTNRTLDSSPVCNTLDQEHWADGLGQFQEMNESPSGNKGKDRALGKQGGPPSITKLTSLPPAELPNPFEDLSSQNSLRTPSSKNRAESERTPLCTSPSTQLSFGTHEDDSVSQSDHSHASTSSSSDSNDYPATFTRPHPEQGSNATVTSRLRSFFRNDGFAPLNSTAGSGAGGNNGSPPRKIDRLPPRVRKVYRILVKYLKFVGPGILLSSSFCDPGNYITGTAAGALYRYKLLFAILLSNFFAVFLQILCTKLGCVTGLDLAQNCRQHLPRWLNISVYVMAEFAIIATDLAEVVGTAISLNILFKIPLSFGVVLTIVDVFVVLLAYRPTGEMKIVRYFEYLVSALVMIVVACFAIELASIAPSDKSEIFMGFLPSKELFETEGIYLFCGILGATVMPHSLYLGSGIVQPRLRDYDQKHGYFVGNTGNEENDEIAMLKYRPSIHAINYSLKYSIVELVISLFTVALFVNSAILIVAGATLANTPEAADADLYSIYDMLRTLLSPLAGTVFALALLFSGQSSGVVCTLAGQMVSEGFLHWSVKPWVRRLITRSLSVIPCFIATLFVGRKGLAVVLTSSQVVLSLLLPFVSAPLLYFTAKRSIMSVPTDSPRIANPATLEDRRISFGRTREGDDLNVTSPFEDDMELADDADVLVSAIAAHSTGRYSSQRYREASAQAELEASRHRPSLGDVPHFKKGDLSPSHTLTDGSHFNGHAENYDDEDDLIVSSNSEAEPLNRDITASSERRSEDEYSLSSSIVVPEYKDMSNGLLTNIAAFTIFFLVSGINLFLIISAALGADVHL